MFAPSELILNPDGSVYHLHLRPEHLAPTVITVGDPDRVGEVSKYFDAVECRIQKREFVTHIGRIGNRRLMVISTGIGTDNVDIVLNELDALANIDLVTRKEKVEHLSLDIIRIGTSGAMQPDIPVDSFLVSEFAVGLDGLMLFYQDTSATVEEIELKTALCSAIEFPLPPYVVGASEDLLAKFPQIMRGITVTCTGFYAPQSRSLRAMAAMPTLMNQLANFQHPYRRLTNFEMETAGIYGLAKVLGHRALSCNAILANRANGTFSSHPEQTTERLIEMILTNL